MEGVRPPAKLVRIPTGAVNLPGSAVGPHLELKNTEAPWVCGLWFRAADGKTRLSRHREDIQDNEYGHLTGANVSARPTSSATAGDAIGWSIPITGRPSGCPPSGHIFGCRRLCR